MFKSLPKFQGFKSKRKENIWQLFRATDFESLMYPCFTFCHILGLFPYKVKTSTIKIYKLYYLLSVIFICSFCIYELIFLYDLNVYNSNIIQSIPTKLHYNCFHICGSFIAVVTFILHKPRMRLIQTIMELSLRLPSKSYQNLSRLIHTKDIFGILIIVVEESMLFSRSPSKVLHKICALYIDLLMFQMDMLYMNCVCVLKACFKQINDNLANLRKFVNYEPYILRGTYHKQKNPFLLIELKALKKQHLIISDTVLILNMVFSLQLLTSIVMTFIEVTFTLYCYLMHWEIGMLMDIFSDDIYDLHLIAIMTYYFIKTVLIVWACETGKNQATEINTTIHNVLNSTNNEQIKFELQLFSLQLMHRKNVFSIKWFTMDATLLTAMAGGITTYLLILIQFLFISRSCGGKSMMNLNVL